ncbi:MAG: hypothetical protein JXK94_03895 [Deltaproteobacteria bacterium]|nr:hypothetical protein [Deltaproteobacteria bacterium]
MAVRHLGVKGIVVGERLEISSSAVSHAVKKGAKLLREDSNLAKMLRETEKL